MIEDLFEVQLKQINQRLHEPNLSDSEKLALIKLQQEIRKQKTTMNISKISAHVITFVNPLYQETVKPSKTSNAESGKL